MFDAVFLRNPSKDQAAAFYTLLSKEIGEVTESELTAAKEALNQFDGRDDGTKEYRDSSVAMSLFVLCGGGTDSFDQENYERVFTGLFPDRANDMEAVEACAQFVANLKTVLYRDLPEKYEDLKEMGEDLENWVPIFLMAKRGCLDAMLRMQDFGSVQAAIRELSGEMLDMAPELMESMVALRNEFGDM